MQPQQIRSRSLTVPVPMDRLPNRGIALGLGELSVKQLPKWRSARISLIARDFGNLLIPFHMAFELLEKVLPSQQRLRTQVLPD
jgi:hypothetical protein